MKKRAKQAARLAVFVYLGIVLLLAFFERHLVYAKPNPADGDWVAENYDLQDITFESADGTKLHGWYAEHPSPRARILFCHGNGEHLGYLGSWLRSLSDEMEASVFAFDYRGYGKSEGSPFEKGVLADGEAAQAWLAERANLSPNQIVLYGRSLGGGVIVHLASKHGARAVIAERTFHSMVDIAARLYPLIPVRLVMRNRYPSAERIAGYSGPWLQLHGIEDTLVPISSGRELFEACPSPKKELLEVPGMGHNDPTPVEFYERMKQFIGQLAPLERDQ